MIGNKMPLNDILARPDIYYVEPSQMTTTAKEDNVKNVNDDDIGMETNRQILLEELSPPRARLNYD
jgi:hypothetical protein